MLLKVLFYLFALALIYSAVRVITAKNPMVAVLHLVLAFVMTSGLWMLIQAEFLAFALIIVYCGAVMVFFLFAVMMLDIPYATVRDGFTKFMPIGLLVAGVLIIEMIWILAGKEGLFSTLYPAAFTTDVVTNSAEGNAYDLGWLLYTEYLYAFEVIALVLLVALIAAICLTHRDGALTRKDVNVSKQIKTDPTERVEVVNMASSTFAPYERAEKKGSEEEQQ